MFNKILSCYSLFNSFAKQSGSDPNDIGSLGNGYLVAVAHPHGEITHLNPRGKRLQDLGYIPLYYV
jgi:hypothetical protein